MKLTAPEKGAVVIAMNTEMLDANAHNLWMKIKLIQTPKQTISKRSRALRPTLFFIIPTNQNG
ncbi:hypothetical protein OQJ13_14290 [Legionella sp. PATHC035]|uniref:hypothetical protein n=1 Tax=Legionella sp. PATHC035 TaxID=2992040 RepID=UPI002242D7CC|nr:hypothetical protein [Legionella sp. PATHC035]MCW8410145.1 hypothetical protein [Legionella sp. PATHC035]